MRLLLSVRPLIILPLVFCLLFNLLPFALSQSVDDSSNPSAVSFLSLPSSFHVAVSVLVRVFSSFSLLFSSLVIAAFFLVPRLRNEYNARFVFFLACSDTLYSFVLLLGPLPAASSSLLFPSSETSSGWCSAHSALLLYASLVSLSWTSVIAINHFFIVFHSASILQLRRYQLIQHLAAWLLPLLPVLLVLLLPSHDAALASPMCWFGMADTRLAYPSSAWLLLVPQLLSCTLLSCCYLFALRYGRQLTSQVVAGHASARQTKETSQIGVSGSTTYHKASAGPAAAQSDRAVLSDKYGQMKRRVSLYLICAFSLTFPLLLSSLSLLPSASLSAGYLSFLFLLQAIVSSSAGMLHSCAYGWNLRLFYHLCPPVSHPPLLTSLLRALHLPPPPPAMSPATSPPFAYASRFHPSRMGQPAASPYMSSRVVSTIGRNSWRASSVQMAQWSAYSNRLPVRRVDGVGSTAGGSGSEDDYSAGTGSLQATPILTAGVLLAPPAADVATDGSSDSISPLVSRTTPPSIGVNSGARRFSTTPTITGLPAAFSEGGSFSVPHPNSITSSPRLSAQGEQLPLHLQPLTSFSLFSNPQSALPWIPSLSLPSHHGFGMPASVASAFAPVRVLRGNSSFSSSSRASVSFISPTHQSSLTPRNDGGGEPVDNAGSGLRVLVSGWDGAGGVTARRSSKEEVKELETLNEEDEKDSEDNVTPSDSAAQSTLHSAQARPTPLLSPSSASASNSSFVSTEQSRGTVILSPIPVPSPTAGDYSRSLSPSASNSATPRSQHTAASRYSFSLPLFGRTSHSTPSSSRSSPHMSTRVMPAGYSPRPSTTFDRRPLRVNPAPPTAPSAAAATTPDSTTIDIVAIAAGAAEAEVVGVQRPKLLASRQSLPSTIAAMPAELRTGVVASCRLGLRRQSEPVATQ